MTTRSDIVRLVAHARTRGVSRTEQVDIRLAERLLMAYVRGDQEALRELEPVEVSRLMAGLLVELSPFPPDEQALDALLTQARQRTESARLM